jgi:hypothetical protein
MAFSEGIWVPRHFPREPRCWLGSTPRTAGRLPSGEKVDPRLERRCSDWLPPCVSDHDRRRFRSRLTPFRHRWIGASVCGSTISQLLQ